jgi:hypothetical protein
MDASEDRLSMPTRGEMISNVVTGEAFIEVGEASGLRQPAAALGSGSLLPGGKVGSNSSKPL